MEASLNTIADALETSEEFKKHWDEYCRGDPTRPVIATVEFATDCFRRLCILPRSARVSEEFIFGIWNHTAKKIAWLVLGALADFHLLLEFEDSYGNMQYGLHDVLLEYCERASQYGESPKYELYHRDFLSFAWKLCHQEASRLSDIATAGSMGNHIGALNLFWLPETWEKIHPWWKMAPYSEKLFELEDYLLQNLFRHLKECDRLGEAVGLLSHMGWTKLRVAHGGLNALNADFSLVENAIREYPSKEREQDERVDARSGSIWNIVKKGWHIILNFMLHPDNTQDQRDDALQGIMSIRNMVGKAWPIILEHPEGLATQAYGHLLDDANKLKVIERYLESARSIVSGPWLKPRRAFWRVLDAGKQRVFRTAEMVVGIAMGSNNVIAATRNIVFWIERETMAATQETVIRNGKGNDSEISAICVCEPQHILVLGFSRGGLEMRNLRNRIKLQEMQGGHEDYVTSVSLSVDGSIAVSGSRDQAIQLWDVGSGSQIVQHLRGHDALVQSVGISADGGTVVSVSEDGNVLLWSRNAMGSQWNQSGACFLPRSEVWGIAFADGDESSSGVMGWLVCPFLKGFLVSELMWPQ